MIFRLFLTALVAYLLGSISTGVIIASLNGRDIRKLGSRNPGATNVLRVIGVKEGLITFFCDIIKAVLALGAGKLLCPQNTEYAVMIAGLFVVIGHNWPVFFAFKGGKGISCTAAVIVLSYPTVGCIAALACLTVIALTRYVSAGSLVLVTLFAILVCATVGIVPQGLWAITLALLAISRHRANIVRLLNGSESKISFHKKKTDETGEGSEKESGKESEKKD